MPHHCWNTPSKCYASERSPVHMSRIHMRSASVQQDNWHTAEEATEEAPCCYCPLAHLPPQPLFHFHLIGASQLCHTKHLPPNISPLHLPRQAGGMLRTNAPLRSCRRAPVPPGAAANEATTPSHVYGALGLLIRGIRGMNLRISHPGRRSTRANVFGVQVWLVFL